MKKKLLIGILLFLFVLTQAGCSQPSSDQYSTANGDTLPVDVCNVGMIANIGERVPNSHAISIDAQLTNNTGTTFTDLYMLQFKFDDGSTGNMVYNGDMAPGQSVGVSGSFNANTSDRVYTVEEVQFVKVLAGFNANDGRKGAISWDAGTGEYSWDYSSK